MADSRFDSRPGGSKSGFDSRPGTSRFDSRPGIRSNETTFPGMYPKKTCIRLLLLAAAAAGVAAAFAASEDFRTWLRVEAKVAPWAAALSGGVATLFLVCAAWIWTGRLRWVAVSPAGIRWLQGPRARHRPRDQYLGVRRGTIEISVWGEDLKAGRYADVEFRKGAPLRISTYTVVGYEELIAQIQTTSADAHRSLFPSGFSSRSGSRSGLAESDGVAYGPLRLHPDGLEWDGKRHRWEDIEDYEIAVGLLRIQPTDGTEFLRRLTELGDWEPVVDLLETTVGSRRANPASPAPTAASPQSPVPEATPSPC